MNEQPIVLRTEKVQALLAGCRTRLPLAACPHGEVGDLFWVRETWWDLGWMENGKWFGRMESHTVGPRYFADCPDPFLKGIGGVSVGQPVRCSWRHTSPCKSTWRKRSARHMPKWAARIWLEITDTHGAIEFRKVQR